MRILGIRRLFRRYSKSLYQVNSHLANNPDLVRQLERLEQAWEAANRYLSDTKWRNIVLYVFHLITSIMDRGFQEAMLNFDAEGLMKLPNVEEKIRT